SARGSGGQDVVEHRLGLLLLGLLGERELRDKDLAGLGEHPLLTRGQAAVLVATGEVAHDLGDLDDVPRGDLLDVRLVPARPVGRLLGVGGTEHLEHLLQAFLADDVAHSDQVNVLGRHLDGEVALGHPELEVELLLAPDDLLRDCFDLGRSVVGIDDGLTDGGGHGDKAPWSRDYDSSTRNSVIPRVGTTWPGRRGRGPVPVPGRSVAERTGTLGPNRRRRRPSWPASTACSVAPLCSAPPSWSPAAAR